MTDLADLVERGDLDELVRAIDGLCESREWEQLVELRERCLRAVERGRQLWPAAHQIEYRLALEAPGPVAATMLVEDAGRFTLGPLSEVAASTHSWSELAPTAPATVVASLCVHERVVRGERLEPADLPGPDPLELPLELLPWEPGYSLASYRSHAVDIDSPAEVALRPASVAVGAERVAERSVCEALENLARAWTSESQGSIRSASVRGSAMDAVAALAPGDARVGELGRPDAIGRMAWAAASGGAHGRRRGAGAGRLDAWLALAALGGLDAGSLDPAEVDASTAGMEWLAWEPPGLVGGWALHLAVADPARGVAFAVSAHDPG